MFGLKLQNSSRIAIVDDEDAAWCSRVKWSLKANGHVCGFFHREAVTLERFVMRWFDEKRDVGHVDGDKLDCRKDNLIEIEWTGNKASRPQIAIRQISNTPTTKYRGVEWSYAMKEWEARIEIDGKSEHLIFSRSDEECAAAYDLACLQKLRKIDPAMLNFSLESYGLTREDLLYRNGKNLH